ELGPQLAWVYSWRWLSDACGRRWASLYVADERAQRAGVACRKRFDDAFGLGQTAAARVTQQLDSTDFAVCVERLANLLLQVSRRRGFGNAGAGDLADARCWRWCVRAIEGRRYALGRRDVGCGGPECMHRTSVVGFPLRLDGGALAEGLRRRHWRRTGVWLAALGHQLRKGRIGEARQLVGLASPSRTQDENRENYSDHEQRG